VASGSIRNPEAYLKAALRRRTERFDDCFPRGITLGDIDSFVEINHRFLFLEWKVDAQQVPVGQWKALYRLAQQPCTSVWILWTTVDGFITHGQRIGTHVTRVAATEDDVKKRLKEWSADAEKPLHAVLKHGAAK
jgi:hypothetical protein